MRLPLAALAVVLGCAPTGRGGTGAPRTAETAVVPSAPSTSPSPEPGGWPGAAPPASDGSSSSAERDRVRADFERVARARDRLEGRDPAACLTPEATRAGDEQPDLRLEVRAPARAKVGDLVELSGTIHNVSRKRAHAIVLPGDGSDAGWRDPVISFTAFLDEGDGCWKALARAPVGRCGLFDSDWSDEIVVLRAGASRSIDPMWSHPFFQWKPGKVRLFVHYAWTGGSAGKGGGGTAPAFDIGAMAKERPYELISNAIELEITG